MSLTFSHSALERPAVLLPVALLLLAAAAGVIWTNVDHHAVRRSTPPAAPAAAASVAILVSATDIAPGQLLTADDFSPKQVEPAKAPAQALQRAEDAQGHVALQPIAAGMPILKQELSAEASIGLSGHIPDSFRAYAIPVSEADIAGGFVQAGDHVDLYVTLPSALFADTSGKKQNDRSKAALLLQSVEVLAVGGKLKGDGSATPSVRTVTLALSPADLAKVALAARLGNISFAIRNPADDRTDPASRAELSSLLGEPPPTAHRAGSGFGIPFYAGRDRSVLRLP